MKLKKSHVVPALVAGGMIGAVVLGIGGVSASPAEGEKIAFNRSKGNCLMCHQIKGGTYMGNGGPELNDMKKRFPDRKELVAIVSDETKRNPLTVMPPFKRNLLLNEQEIESIVDFLYTR
jgi:sulfur-oxidizing protein SoxX